MASTPASPSSAPILIASDHAGVELKALLQKNFPKVAWKDLGPFTTESVDYPDYAAKVASEIAEGRATRGVLLCGSGVGMSITANRFSGVRAVLAESPEVARLSRQHNDSNILCMGSRILAPAVAQEVLQAWLETPFSGEARHQARIDKIKAFEGPGAC